VKAHYTIRTAFLPELGTALFVLTALLLTIPLFTAEGYLGGDSDQYSEFGEALLAGKVLRHHTDPEITVGEQLRSPGYPAILALAALVTGEKPGSSFVGTHVVLSAIAFIGLSLSLRGLVRPLFIFVPFSMCAWQMRDIFNAHVSEWSALCSLLVLLACSLHFFHGPSPWRLWAVGFLTSVTILIRPALLGIGVLPIVLVLIKPTWKSACIAVASFAPLLIWLSINTYRLDAPILAAKDGFALFYGTPMLGDAPIDQASEEDTAFFIFMNDVTQKAQSGELCCSIALPNQQLLTKMKYNVEQAKQWENEHHIPWLRMNMLMRSYSVAVIKANFRSYIRMVFGNFVSIVPTGLLLIPGVGIAFSLMRTEPLRPLGWTVLLGIIAHFLHLGGILLTQPLGPRYVTLTLYAAITMSLIGAVPWAQRAFLGKK